MRKLSKGLDKKIKNLAREITRLEFIEMINPAMRGSAWDWNNFPSYSEERVARHLHFYLTDRQMKDEATFWWAKLYANKEAVRILGTTDVCRWSKYVV